MPPARLDLHPWSHPTSWDSSPLDDSDCGSELLTAEAEARVEIDRLLGLVDWVVQDADAVNLAAARGVAVREFILEEPHGRADYLLFLDRKPVGAIEAKPAGTTLTGVEWQSTEVRMDLEEDEAVRHTSIDAQKRMDDT